jgi:glycosyltransferase involved in cell wall biosynthesis/SAM-dependent methyltransferase
MKSRKLRGVASDIFFCMKPMDKPLVSIITPFFNAGRFIEEAIKSVLGQTYGNWEMLMVDDGSADESTRIAMHYAEKYPDKMRYLEHKGHKNRGASASRNFGIHHSQGDYIAFLDCDDVYFPEKLEKQVPILESQPEAAMLFGATEYWYSWTGNPEDLNRDYIWNGFGVEPDTLVKPPTLLRLLLKDSMMPCPCSFLVRREAIDRIHGFEESFRYIYTDQVFFAKLCLSENVFVSSGCWEKYRQHPDSCCHFVEKRGEATSARLFFLDWLEKYLIGQEYKGSDIWKTFEREKALYWPYRHQILNRLLPLVPRLSGRAWQYLVQQRQNPLALPAPPLSNAKRSLAAVYEGYHDLADCEKVRGWVWDLNRPDVRINVDIFADNILVARVTADEHRQDLADAGKGDGSHAFRYALPPWLRDGKPHFISVKVAGSDFELTATPKTIQCELQIISDIKKLKAALRGSALNKLIPVSAFRRGWAKWQQKEYIPEVGSVHFGSLRRLTPISRVWGTDRGHPVDRYYIKRFLAANSDAIRGRVLEIGNNGYTRAFGGDRVIQSDVLNLSKDVPGTTIVADLAAAPHVPSDIFDCIICTQTLQYVYEVKDAVQTLYRILNPGGILLVTLPGISQTYDDEWGDCWYWNFTGLSASRLFEDVFTGGHVKVLSHGNVLAAVSFLHGLAVEELRPEELDYREPGYDVLITVVAVKPKSVI